MNVEIKRHLKARPPDWHHCDGCVIRDWARISLQELAYRFMVYFLKVTFNILIARNTFQRWRFMKMERSKMANPLLIWVTVTSFLVCTVQAAEQLENIFDNLDTSTTVNIYCRFCWYWGGWGKVWHLNFDKFPLWKSCPEQTQYKYKWN